MEKGYSQEYNFNMNFSHDILSSKRQNILNLIKLTA